MTIEIHNAELESILRQYLISGQLPLVEDLLLKTLKASHAPVSVAADPHAQATAAAAQIRHLRTGITLDRPPCASLRDYAHAGHRF
ncbi:MAG: hypothetical protein IPJ98_11050 [Bryobacterales bacterium]|nr:hypothetical protein [Bryobacterales bacterium]